MDKRFGHVQDVSSGMSLRDQFADKGFYYHDSYKVSEKNPELHTGIQSVRNYLKFDKVTNLPYLLIDPSCVNVIRSFERWSLDPKTMKPLDDVWKNFMDVVRYACAANLGVSENSEPDMPIEAPMWNV
jgi:hypothetical protein